MEVVEKGLSNLEIEHLAKIHNIRHFKGCFMNDELEGRIGPNECAVVNYENSDQGGSHWVAYYNRQDFDVVCYFDSMGLPPTEELLSYLKSSDKLILRNNYVIQEESWTCGVLVMMFLKKADESTNPWEPFSIFDGHEDDLEALIEVLELPLL